MYVNGVGGSINTRVTTVPIKGTMGSADWFIGRQGNTEVSDGYFSGSSEDVRVLNDTAKYTQNFTPQSPLN